ALASGVGEAALPGFGLRARERGVAARRQRLQLTRDELAADGEDRPLAAVGGVGGAGIRQVGRRRRRRGGGRGRGRRRGGDWGVGRRRRHRGGRRWSRGRG